MSDYPQLDHCLQVTCCTLAALVESALQRRECERKSERKRGVKDLYHLEYGNTHTITRSRDTETHTQSHDHLIYGDGGRARKGLLACAKGLLACACVEVFGASLTCPASLSPSATASASTSCVYAKWPFVLHTFWLPFSEVCIGEGEERLVVEWWCVGATGGGEYDVRDVNSNSRSGTLIAASCVCE